MKKIIFILSFFILLIGLSGIWTGYELFYKKLKIKTQKPVSLYIYNDTKWQQIDSLIKEHYCLPNEFIYNKLTNYKKLPENFKQGHYLLSDKLTVNQLINSLRYGNQTPVKVTFNSINKLSDFADNISQQLLFNASDLTKILYEKGTAQKFGFNDENFLAMFIPNTYELYWTVTVEEFLNRMYKEYHKFWTDERKQKAQAINLSHVEVSILASIVEKETNIKKEMPVVAGVYLNRLKKNMPLQADPTVIFALSNFEIRRVTNKMTEYDSPYNTYKYAGLPPGPIYMPSITAIDAVLNHSKHNYLYFCASPKLDGTHAFATDHKQHSKNAAEYHKALNKLKIFR